jgi:hypothetical protein
MKKCALLLLLAVVIFRASYGQSGEIKAYLQQIAAYEVYIKDAEKGYKIVENGIHTVGEIKNGTFNLHSVFFSSLQAVNPSVKGFAEVAQIALIEIATVEMFKKTVQNLNQSGQLHSDELAYIGQVYSSIVSAGLQDVTALTALITSGDYSMNDGDRIHGIDGIYSNAVGRYTFTQAFTAQCALLDRSRAGEALDINEVGNLYGIK